MTGSRAFGLAAAAALAVPGAATAQAASAEAITRAGNPTGVIASAVTVPDGAKLVFLSGSTASPLDPARPDDLGDTRQQTLSILTKMKTNLAAMGLTMGDIVKLTVFLVAPTPGGRMDSAAMNDVFKTFFGTADQPNKPARSTVQVAQLGRPTTYVEIEGIAARIR